MRKQAAMLAFDRLFLGFGVMMLAALPPLLLMRRAQYAQDAATEAH